MFKIGDMVTVVSKNCLFYNETGIIRKIDNGLENVPEVTISDPYQVEFTDHNNDITDITWYGPEEIKLTSLKDIMLIDIKRLYV